MPHGEEEAMNKPLNMPIAPSATIQHKIAWRKCKSFPLDASVRVISSHNPWRPNAHGYNLFEMVLRKKPMTTAAIGYFETDTMSKLRWLYTWGDFIEVNGQRHFPKQEPLPGMEE
jgi:hypothetical protein